VQFDPALSYGLVEYLRTLDMLRGHGWSPRRCVPHGGHQFALNIAVGLGLGGNDGAIRRVFAPFRRLRRQHACRAGPHQDARYPRHRLRSQGGAIRGDEAARG